MVQIWNFLSIVFTYIVVLLFFFFFFFSFFFFAFFDIKQFVFVKEIIIKYRITVYSFISDSTYTQQQHSKYLQNTSFTHLSPKYQRFSSAPLPLAHLSLARQHTNVLSYRKHVYVCLSAMKFQSHVVFFIFIRLLLQSLRWMCPLIVVAAAAAAAAVAVAVYRFPATFS